MRGIFQEKISQRVHFMPVLLSIYMRSVDGFMFYCKLQYYVPDTIDIILHYHTVCYFLWFFVFLYHTQTQNVGGTWMYWDVETWGGGRCEDEMIEDERCIWNQSSHEVWSAPCVEEAQAHQWSSRLLGIPETIAILKSLTAGVLEFWAKVLLCV